MGSERVKGSDTKTNWKRRTHPGPSRVIFRNLSVKVVARILRRILVTLYVIVINQTRFYSQITSTEARGRSPRVEVLVA